MPQLRDYLEILEVNKEVQVKIVMTIGSLSEAFFSTLQTIGHCVAPHLSSKEKYKICIPQNANINIKYNFLGR